MTAWELIEANPNAAEITIERAELVGLVEELREASQQINDLENDARRLERRLLDQADGTRKHIARLIAFAYERADADDLDDPLHEVLDVAQRALGCLDG